MQDEESRRGESRTGRGKWFLTVEYWLYPVSLAEQVRNIVAGLPDPRREAIFSLDDKGMVQLDVVREDVSSAVESNAFKAEAEAWPDRLDRLFNEVDEAEAKIYNAQPVWHLRELAVPSPDEALTLVNEFVEKIAMTSSEYGWPHRDPGKEVRWRVHGWKHIEFGSIESLWKEYQRGDWPATLRAEALGTPDEVRKLFISAANHDPESVGILWKLFPTRKEHTTIISKFGFETKPEEIPDPSTLASGLVNKLYFHPDPKEGEQARVALLRLISQSVSRGGQSRRGRPRNIVSRYCMQLLWKMSYSLVQQAVEVSRFLSLYRKLEKDRQKILFGFYPWIRRTAPDLETFLSYGPSKGSLELLAHLTGVSASSLEKMSLRTRV